jgi:diguanylate cyclase (GGDEF)-like protein/PAS domain S-box-containing protein
VSRTQRAALASGAATALFLLWIAKGVGGPRVTLFVDDLGVFAATVVASVACAWAARRGAGRAWIWLSLWTGLWAAGGLAWAVYELLLNVEAPYPSLADVGYLGSIPFAVIGLFAFPGARRAGMRLRSLIDGLVIAGCLVGVTWELVLVPTIREATGGLEVVLGLAYPVTDLILIVIAVSVAARSLEAQRRSLAILALAIAAIGAADCFYLGLAATGNYSTGQLFDSLWFLGFLLVGVAAVSALEQPKGEGVNDTSRLMALLDAAPYLPIALMLGMAGWGQVRHGQVDAGLVVTGVPVFALTLARQILINLDNTRLARRLRREAANHRAAEATLAEAQRTAHLGSWDWDVSTGQVDWSDELFRIFGLEPRSFEPTFDAYMARVHPADLPRMERVVARVSADGVFEDTIVRIVRPDGVVRWILAQAETQGKRVVGTVLDVTERKEAEAELHAAEVRFRQGFEHSPVGMLITEPEGPIVSVNPAMCSILGRTPAQLVGRRPRDFFHSDDFEAAGGARKRALMTDGPGLEEYDARLLRPDGTAVWCAMRASLVRDDAGAPLYFFGQVQDITDRRQAEVALAHQATHDPLTGAANRVALQTALDASVDEDVALLVIDLDGFKDINDSLGHEVGDRVLREIANRLRHATRPRDCVARVGGDEFAVLLHGIGGDEFAGRVARKLLAAVEESMVMEGIVLQVGASIGTSVARVGEPDKEGLMRRADVAMYRAKKEGTGVAAYLPSDDHDGASRLALVADLRTAISNGEIGVHYQPKVAVCSGIVVGVEALARWNHPTRGPISPAEFIPLAEHTGLILPLTRRILDEALAQCASWDASGLHVGMSVNLSPRLLHDPDLTTWIHVALRVHSLPGERLTLEITENALVEGPVTVEAMTALRGIGVRLSIDDLGTGYSSLMYLKRLPIDELKIDRVFITDLATDPRDQAIVRAIVDLGRSLDLTVVAEGVENEASVELLRRLRCPVAQGFHCRRPGPADELTPWLQQQAQIVALN